VAIRKPQGNVGFPAKHNRLMIALPFYRRIEAPTDPLFEPPKKKCPLPNLANGKNLLA
jgi:hypothetical protein